ncbi:MAG: hypothetical protein PHQ58_04495 [Rhodoferax sp.]|uniref:hypothetical protein n=1 Tax=Rhodoferax sp. TaxID=50421 RepID=UPI002608853E|nr:hypothetical protein [Rhodoferax sp.]MDD2879675.1 hypothetical protein [Rhodoferax sp.]
MRKGIMAFESMDGEVDGGADVAEFAESAESDIIEMDEANNNIQGLDDGMDEAEETADTLDKMGESLGEAAEDGGISEPAAEAVRVAVEHLCARIGMPAGTRVMPSMESFGDRSSRVAATMEAMDGIKARAKSIWEAIVKVFNQAIDWVKDFFRKLTDGSLKLKKRAEKIITETGKLGSKTIKADAKIAAGGFGKQLVVGDKIPEGSDFVSKVGEYSKTQKELNTKIKGMSDNGKNAVKDIMSAVESGDALKEKIGKAAKTMLGMWTGKNSSNTELQIDGMQLGEYALIFGNKSFYSRVPMHMETQKEDAAFEEMIKNTKFTVANSAGEKEAKELAKEITALQKEEIKSVATAIKANMELYKDYNKEIKALEESRDSVRKGMDRVKNAFSESDRTAARIAKIYVSALTAGASSLRSYDIKTCKAALDYCTASLKSAGAPEAKKEGK